MDEKKLTPGNQEEIETEEEVEINEAEEAEQEETTETPDTEETESQEEAQDAQPDEEEQEEPEEEMIPRSKHVEEINRVVTSRLERQKKKLEKESGVSYDDLNKYAWLIKFIAEDKETNDFVRKRTEEVMGQNPGMNNANDARARELDLKEARIELMQDPLYKSNEDEIIDYCIQEDFDPDNPRELKLGFKAWKADNAGQKAQAKQNLKSGKAKPKSQPAPTKTETGKGMRRVDQSDEVDFAKFMKRENKK